MKLSRAGEAEGSESRSLNSGTKHQVVSLNSLRKNLTRQMLILRYFSGITAPVVACYHADVKRGGQGKQCTACFIGSWAKDVSQNAPVFVLYAYQSQYCRALLPTKLHCSSSSQIRATSAGATGEDVTSFGVSFLKPG